MDSENRNKRDLPEVVADILVVLDKVQQTQQQMQQTQQQMQQTQQQQHEQIIHAFNTMTNAVLDAMNRQTERYDRTIDAQASQETEVRDLKQRVENLEKTVYNKAS
ncbi:hypothetical protein [uncultured Hymenobacter sp.]|uniref:hypothetical protein n=1 Tax=uncultured Hymenobacter sp. TaxID=170016 RepID=UPI0035C9A828